jgi:RHS repeat-associated protein
MKKSNLQDTLTTLFAALIILTSFSISVFASTYEYDANGNMVKDSEKNQCYLYNQANQLKEVNNCSGRKIAQYWYDYTGRRIMTVEYNSTGGNITTYYPFPDAEIVMNGTQMLNTTYIYANGERVARIDPDGSKHYYSGDHLGSTSIVTDENGSIEEKTRYKPYGSTLSHTGVNTTKHLYTGQEKDTETGLYYYRARYYDPNLARFVQPDSVMQNVYDPQMLNRYSYVRNNPLKYTDPTGQVAKLTINDEDMTITIEANYYIYGKGASKNVATIMQSEINDAWSGQMFTDKDTGKEYTLTTKVTVTYVENAPDKSELGEYDNLIEIKSYSQDPLFRSHVEPDHQTGEWSPASLNNLGFFTLDTKQLYAHETGHLFGLRDRYDDVCGISVPNGDIWNVMTGGPHYWDSLMGTAWTDDATEKDITNLVSKSYKEHTDMGQTVTTHKIGLPYKYED